MLDMDNLIRERGSINASNALAESLTEYFFPISIFLF